MQLFAAAVGGIGNQLNVELYGWASVALKVAPIGKQNYNSRINVLFTRLYWKINHDSTRTVVFVILT